jgi:hypothetical protein
MRKTQHRSNIETRSLQYDPVRNRSRIPIQDRLVIDQIGIVIGIDQCSINGGVSLKASFAAAAQREADADALLSWQDFHIQP